MKFEYGFRVVDTLNPSEDGRVYFTLDILKQPESLRGKGDIGCFNGYKIRSATFPGFSDGTIFIGGESRSNDIKGICRLLSASDIVAIAVTLYDFRQWVEENIEDDESTEFIENNYNLILCKHDNSSKQYLFRLPDNCKIESGCRVFAETQMGEQSVTTTSNSFILPRAEAKIIKEAFGAYKPLKYVIGRAVVKEVCEKFEEVQ